MTEVAVCGSSHNFTVDSTELLNSVTKCDDLGGAYKREVKWVEKEDQIFAFVVIKGDILEFAINNGGALEMGSWLGDLELRHWDNCVLTGA